MWFNKHKSSERKAEGVDKLKAILREILQHIQDRESWENTLKVVQRNYRSFALLKDLQDLISLESKKENTMFLSDTKHILADFIKDTDTPFIYASRMESALSVRARAAVAKPFSFSRARGSSQ